jgi:hypothetical protein
MVPARKAFGLVALVAALGTVLVSAQLSSATHVRPKGATPLYVPLAIAYKACTAPNSNHNGGVAAPSCAAPVGPVQESSFLTVGTPDSNGAGANMTGFVRLVVKITSPEDILVTSTLTDVRCKPATSATVCNSANTADGPDYSGQLQGTAQLRITDHFNGASGTDTGTVIDLGVPLTANCVNTATNAAAGGTCSINTTANTVLPGAVADGKRANIEVQTIDVKDGGSSGVASAPDATRFATQGIFIP